VPDLEGRAPPPITLDRYQWQWGGGLVFGEDTWCIVDGAPEGIFEVQARTADVPIPGGHGATMLPYYAQASTVVLPLTVLAPAHTEQMRAQLDALKNAFPLDTAATEKALRWRMAGDRQWIRYARVARMAIHVEPRAARLGAVPVTVALACTDPRYYLDQVESMTVGPYSPGPQGGWELGGDLPLDNTAPVVPPGDQYATSIGNAVAWPLIRFYVAAGELTSLELEISNPLAEYEALLALDFGSTGPTAGDVVWVDADAYVRAAGAYPVRVEHADGTTTNAYAAWQHPRQPPGLPPGENTIRFTPVGTDEVTARIDYRSTWL
jgi:hypothetical protein